jgi:hypothetical protein
MVPSFYKETVASMQPVRFPDCLQPVVLTKTRFHALAIIYICKPRANKKGLIRVFFKDA